MTFPPEVIVPGRALRDHLPEAEWRAVMAGILDGHGLARTELAPFDSGSDVVWGTPRHVVKLTTPRWRCQMLGEAAWLRHLFGKLDVATQEVVAEGEVSGWSYLVTTRLPGRAIGAVWPQLERAARESLAEQLGAFVANLYAAPTPDWAPPWRTFGRIARATSREYRARRMVSDTLIASAERYLVSHGVPHDGFPAHSGVGVLHTELLGEHVLVDGPLERPRIVAAIDFADARVGPADYDVAAVVEFILKGEAGLLRRFLLARGDAPASLDAQRSRDLLAWDLCHRFSNLPRLVAALGREPAEVDEFAATLFAL